MKVNELVQKLSEMPNDVDVLCACDGAHHQIGAVVYVNADPQVIGSIDYVQLEGG